MQGPGGKPPVRRAGDPGGTTDPSGLKDWQKNTWYGPVPTRETNPFDEPDSAPELLELRSENVMEHSGEFWQDKQQTAKIPGGRTETARRRNTSGTKNGKQQGKGMMWAALSLIVIAAAVTAILYFFVFRIREIRVTGNEVISSSDIIRFSGMKYGDSILTLNEDEIAERMIANAHKAVRTDTENPNYNYYRLEFRYLEREMPGTVIVTVKEREACCWTRIYGRMYVMDKELMILFDSDDMGIQPELVEVTGLEVRSDPHVGQTMTLKTTVQQELFEELFLEMKVLSCTHLIREAKLNDTMSLYIETRDGFTVCLGDRRRLHAKLRSLLLVREELLRLGKTGGTIDVSSPETPYYSPSPI